MSADNDPTESPEPSAGRPDNSAMQHYKDEIAARLRLWRRSVLKLSQDEFARKTGMNLNLIKKFESTKLQTLPSTPSLLAMATTGLNIHWLLTGLGRMSISTKLDVAPADDHELIVELRLREISHLLEQLEPLDRRALAESLRVTVENSIKIAAMESAWSRHQLGEHD